VRERGAPTFSRNIALFGTASDVGKSILAAAFCRLIANHGLQVAPFKAQNMSNNAAVAFDGGEIGRAQYVQAIAARVAPSIHHNPVLLKPTSQRSSQVVVRGEVHSNTLARDYFERGKLLGGLAFESLRLLQSRHDVIVLEGAGSCAEVNLRSREFVNFPAAHEAQARVVLVADIERGGVFAQVVGSLDLLQPEDRARVCGVIVNKFRGDPTLFDDGVRFLEQRTGVPVLGVIPHLPDANIDGEDSLNAPVAFSTSNAHGRIAVLCYPHLANFTDFDALQLEDVEVHFVRHATSLATYRAVILPGSKAVSSDLEWLRQTGLARELARYVASDGKVLGVCGGMQMLGRTIDDPHGVESSFATFDGLGHLALSTRFERQKTVRRTAGTLAGAPEVAVDGYEIHHGVSHHDYPVLFELRVADASHAGYRDGVRTHQFWGTYVHGLFDAPGFRHAFLRWALGEDWRPKSNDHRQRVLDNAIDRFAAHVESHLAWSRVLDWLRTEV
jgi:adenosylcobyric acid synthase